MDYITGFAIIIILIVLGFIFFLFSPRPKLFYDPSFDNPFISVSDQIANEVQINTEDPIIPIYRNGQIYNRQYPQTYEQLRQISNIYQAGIINLKPKFEQQPTYATSSYANYIIRYFYPISAQKSGIWVDGAKKFFKENEWLGADISREHSLFNKHKRATTQLIFIDVVRVSGHGNSPNHESDDVIKSYKLSLSVKE